MFDPLSFQRFCRQDGALHIPDAGPCWPSPAPGPCGPQRQQDDEARQVPLRLQAHPLGDEGDGNEMPAAGRGDGRERDSDARDSVHLPRPQSASGEVSDCVGGSRNRPSVLNRDQKQPVMPPLPAIEHFGIWGVERFNASAALAMQVFCCFAMAALTVGALPLTPHFGFSLAMPVFR